jgi:hypothetical protein
MPREPTGLSRSRREEHASVTETAHRGEPRRIGEVLDTVGRRLGLSSARDIGRLWRAWSDIVGAAVAAHAEPTSLREGVLRVRAESPAWAAELGYLADDIRERANGFLGEQLIEELRVWVGPGHLRQHGATPPTPPKEPLGRSPAAETSDPMEALERARYAWAGRPSRRGGNAPGTAATWEKPC